ncbi:MAG TPA: type II toxin-antitoxin system HicB family antitoxin [Aurantimonas sp.]
MNNHYAVECFWSDDDEGYIAVAPDLPGCSAFGETRESAMVEIDDAIASWIEAARAVKNVVPEPRLRKPASSYSGKVLLRMPKDLHGDLSRAAEDQGVSMNSYLCFLLSQTHYAEHAIRQFWGTLQWSAASYTTQGRNINFVQVSLPRGLKQVRTDMGSSSLEFNTLTDDNISSGEPLATIGVNSHA